MSENLAQHPLVVLTGNGSNVVNAIDEDEDTYTSRTARYTEGVIVTIEMPFHFTLTRIEALIWNACNFDTKRFCIFETLSDEVWEEVHSTLVPFKTLTTVTKDGDWSNTTIDAVRVHVGGETLGTNSLEKRIYEIYLHGYSVLDSGLRVKDSVGVIKLGCYGDETESVLRLKSPDSVLNLFLVAVDDPFASPVRIQTPDGVKAIAKVIE